jgi:hypothetical protein
LDLSSRQKQQEQKQQQQQQQTQIAVMQMSTQKVSVHLNVNTKFVIMLWSIVLLHNCCYMRQQKLVRQQLHSSWACQTRSLCMVAYTALEQLEGWQQRLQAAECMQALYSTAPQSVPTLSSPS